MMVLLLIPFGLSAAVTGFIVYRRLTRGRFSFLTLSTLASTSLPNAPDWRGCGRRWPSWALASSSRGLACTCVC